MTRSVFDRYNITDESDLIDASVKLDQFLKEAVKQQTIVPDTKVVTLSRADQNGTLTRKSNYFEARLLSIRQWKMYVGQVSAQNEHSPP